LIEGHTDDDLSVHLVPADNWDLSTKRATAIVAILSENSINKQNLTAAGRSEFSPLIQMRGGKAKRRIEIIQHQD
jgi:chemotaxis protein MotB